MAGHRSIVAAIGSVLYRLLVVVLLTYLAANETNLGSRLNSALGLQEKRVSVIGVVSIDSRRGPIEVEVQDQPIEVTIVQ